MSLRGVSDVIHICTFAVSGEEDNRQLQRLSLIYNEKFILYPNRYISLPFISLLLRSFDTLSLAHTFSQNMFYIIQKLC